jgi:DNA uptake protein ComE-like DNA-binding protein
MIRTREVVHTGLITLASCLILFWLAACSNRPRNDQQLQQQAAQTTEQIKAGAQQAAQDAKIAAANAERQANDIANGVKEGLHDKTSPDKTSPYVPASGSIDINSATESSLTTLPGITASRARRIVDNRPYDRPHDLVSKGVLSEAEYDRIAGEIVARNG